MTRVWLGRFVIGAATTLLCAANVRAGVWEDVAIGLGAAGFDIRGDNNPLSGGYEFLITNQFNGEKFDFGAAELTLDGPVSLSAEIGGRIVNNIDLGLSTALNADADPSPLTYELVYDVGGQRTEVSGSLLMDGDVNINEFLYYDVSLQYSSRQTVVNDGSIDEGESNFDTDFGPINIRGNLVIDALAAVTDPFFSAAGTENPFQPLTAEAQIQKALGNQISAALSDLADGAGRATAPSAYGPFRFDGPSEVGALESNGALLALRGAPAADGGVVPEPSVLILMLAGLVVLPRALRKHVA